jgi:hypothetical protein
MYIQWDKSYMCIAYAQNSDIRPTFVNLAKYDKLGILKHFIAQRRKGIQDLRDHLLQDIPVTSPIFRLSRYISEQS